MAEAQATEVDPEAVVTLQSQEGHNYQVKAKIARMSQTIKDTMDDTGTDDPIPLPNVKANILSQVITYCTEHVEGKEKDEHGRNKKTDEDLQAFDEEFVRNLDQSTLFELILAANYLNMKELLDLTCNTVAKMIKGKTPQEIRDTFGIVNDFTPEEEEEVYRENQWAFE